MIVPTRSSHPTRLDVVGRDVAVIAERIFADGAYAVLCDYLVIKKLSHFAVGAKFSVASGVLRVLDAPNARLARSFFLRNGFPATTRQ